MKAVLAAATMLLLVVLSSVANAATVRCRIEKPASIKWDGGLERVGITNLAATNLPKGRGYEAPCASANRLAWEFEYHWGEGEAPSVLTTPPRQTEDRWQPIPWNVHYKNQGVIGRLGEIEGVTITAEEEENGVEGPPIEALTATFQYGSERVSLWAETE